jgi:hypothetical protein
MANLFNILKPELKQTQTFSKIKALEISPAAAERGL